MNCFGKHHDNVIRETRCAAGSQHSTACACLRRERPWRLRRVAERRPETVREECESISASAGNNWSVEDHAPERPLPINVPESCHVSHGMARICRSVEMLLRDPDDHCHKALR